MYQTSELYKTLLADPLHWKETKLDIAGTEYTESNIVSAVIPPSALYEKFGIGNCVARELDIEVFPIGTIPRQAEIKAYARLVLGDQTSEWVPQGVFYISTRRKNKLTGTFIITAFDAMLKAEDVWLTDEYDLDDWPKSQQDAVDDIAYRMGVEVDPRTALSDEFPVDYPVDENGDLAMREVLSGIAVSNGGNWTITDEGKLRLLVAADSKDEILLENNLADMDVGEPSLPVSKVILNVDSETCYMAGDDTGSTVEADCPWVTQEMADGVLAKLTGYVYKPFTGTDALLDPAAELGDTVVIDGKSFVLAQIGRNLDRQGAASIGAPGTDEIEDEYPYKSKQRKQTDRALAKTYSVISKTASEIRQEIANEVEGLSSSFSVQIDRINGEIVGLQNAHSQLELTLDGLITRIQDAEGNIGTLELSTQEFRTSIEGLEGDYAELVLTLDGLTVTDDEGTTKIKGSSIETETLYVNAANINGTLKLSQMASISFGDLSDSETVETSISDAYDLAYDAYQLAESNELPSYIKSTYIASTEIRSPTIKSTNFGIYPTASGNSYVSSQSGSLSLYGYYSSTLDELFKLSYHLDVAPHVDFGSPCSAYANWDFGITNFHGRIDFTGCDKVALPYGYSLPASGETGGIFFLLE